MSANTIPTRSDTQTIDQTWFNVLQAALSGDQVPRNTSGAPTNAAGNLGSTDYGWGALFLASGSTGFMWEAVIADGATADFSWTIPSANPNEFSKLLIDTSGNLTYLNHNNVGLPVSNSSGSWSTQSTSSVVIGATNSAPQSVSIPTLGGSVLVSMQSIIAISGSPAQCSLANTAAAGGVDIQLYRNSNGGGDVLISSQQFSNAAISTGAPLPASFIYHDMNVPAGTNVYTWRAVVNATTTTFTANNLVTTAKEF